MPRLYLALFGSLLFWTNGLSAQIQLEFGCGEVHNYPLPVFSSDSILIRDGSGAGPADPGLSCFTEVFFAAEIGTCISLQSNQLDLGSGDTLRIYEQGNTCADAYSIWTYTQEDDAIGLWIWRERFFIEYITDAENPGEGWEFVFRPHPFYCEFPGLNPLITTPSEDPVVNCTIELDGLLMNDECTTDTNGKCFLNYWGNMENDSVWVEPISPNDNLNGVTALDLFIIRKHILGIEPFADPYKFIAADANNSGTVTTLDIVTLQLVILGIESSFPNNQSWRFPFPCDVEANGWTDFREALWVTTNFPNPIPRFYAIKVGDVNDTAILEF